jgi:predicted dehydrogenase
MSNTESIGVAFLGFGRMGETHLRNLAAIAGVRVVVVADERADRAELGKAMSGAELATKDQGEAINHPSAHAVVISTPTDTHARLIELVS